MQDLPMPQQIPAMEDELMAQQPSAPGQAAPKSLSAHLKPMITNPAEDFVVTMMEMADGKGVLDKAFGPMSVEDQADLADQNSDPMQFLSREELQILMDKFMAIPEPQRTQLGDAIKAKLPSAVAQRLESIMRMTHGRDAQQQVAPRSP